MMVYVDSNSRTLTATFCFSAVLVHERRFKLGFGVAELVVKITTSTAAASASAGFSQVTAALE